MMAAVIAWSMCGRKPRRRQIASSSHRQSGRPSDLYLSHDFTHFFAKKCLRFGAIRCARLLICARSVTILSKEKEQFYTGRDSALVPVKYIRQTAPSRGRELFQ